VNKADIQDIEANIRILEKGGIQAKIHSFLCLWYPFRGSIEEHIKFLENLKRGALK